LESNPGLVGGHEEGGFLLADALGATVVHRWPIGSQRRIIPVPHANCRVGGKEIIASFHTHPNVSADFIQEPSEQDRRAVRSDPDLKGAEYLGEFVISNDKIYLVDPSGLVHDLGSTSVILEMN
jgi:proteasome lid subunit RPN8/RPN11